MPKVVAAGPVAASPSWPLSKSRSTRSRAASRARCFSSSASFLRASSLTFCRLMSSSWVTVCEAYGSPPKRHANGAAYQDRCTHIPCRTCALSYTLRDLSLSADTVHMHRSGAWIHFLDVAVHVISECTRHAEGSGTHSLRSIVEFLVFGVGEDGRRCVVLAVFCHFRESSMKVVIE